MAEQSRRRDPQGPHVRRKEIVFARRLPLAGAPAGAAMIGRSSVSRLPVCPAPEPSAGPVSRAALTAATRTARSPARKEQSPTCNILSSFGRLLVRGGQARPRATGQMAVSSAHGIERELHKYDSVSHHRAVRAFQQAACHRPAHRALSLPGQGSARPAAGTSAAPPRNSSRGWRCSSCRPASCRGSSASAAKIPPSARVRLLGDVGPDRLRTRPDRRRPHAVRRHEGHEVFAV